jgi:hypothetical protein
MTKLNGTKGCGELFNKYMTKHKKTWISIISALLTVPHLLIYLFCIAIFAESGYDLYLFIFIILLINLCILFLNYKISYKFIFPKHILYSILFGLSNGILYPIVFIVNALPYKNLDQPLMIVHAFITIFIVSYVILSILDKKYVKHSK